MNNLKFAAIALRHAQHGGTTTNIIHGDLTGEPFYSVAVYPDRERKLTSELTSVALQKFYDSNLDLFKRSDVSLGTWLDKVTGTTYLDVVRTLRDREHALSLARTHRQLAIFDLAKGVEIRLDEKVAA